MNVENKPNINFNSKFEELHLEIQNSKFIESLIQKHKYEIDSNTFSFNEIDNINYNDINDLYSNDESKQKAKILKIATMFSDDKYLTNTLFNIVLDKNTNEGISYLIDRYNDKNIYMSSVNNKMTNLDDMLNSYISNKIYNNLSNSINQISDEFLNNILVNINSYNFLTALSNTSKNGYNRYKDKDDKYSFLYNDYYIKYEELLYKYKKQNSEENAILKQFTT